MSGRIRVVLAEDNLIFRRTLAMLLELDDAIEIVGSVATGAEAIGACAELRPDVVVMDYRMPGLNGAEATAAVLEASPGSRVVCLTASVSGDERRAILAAGAVACLMKDDELEEIVAAIRGAAPVAGP